MIVQDGSLLIAESVVATTLQGESCTTQVKSRPNYDRRTRGGALNYNKNYGATGTDITTTTNENSENNDQRTDVLHINIYHSLPNT